MNFWRSFDTWKKNPDIKVGRYNLEFVNDAVGARHKFVKFYVEADVVDGIVLNYSFSSLLEDIRRTFGSLRHHTSSNVRVEILRVSELDSLVVQLLSWQTKEIIINLCRGYWTWAWLSFSQLVNGRNSTNPAIWLVPGAGGIFSSGSLQRAESVVASWVVDYIARYVAIFS